LHLLTSVQRYGFFRDELYYLDLARHLDWGYVDCAPLVAVYAKIALLMGGSLAALRIIPAIAGIVLIVITSEKADVACARINVNSVFSANGDFGRLGLLRVSDLSHSIAGGALAIEEWLTNKAAWTQVAVTPAIVMLSLPLVPMATWMLSPEHPVGKNMSLLN
jgi:hypothetical protein